MKKSHHNFPYIFLWLMIVFSIAACQSNDAEGKENIDTDLPEADLNENDQIAIPVFDKLDHLPFSSMTQASPRQIEAGDCENTLFRYSIDNWVVVLDSLACSEYYRQRTYFQLTEAGDITMVHFQYLEPFVDPDSGTLFYALEEKIMDFSSSVPVMNSRVDTLQRASSDLQGGFDYFSRSKARMIQTKGAVEELDRAYWQSKYTSLVN